MPDIIYTVVGNNPKKKATTSVHLVDSLTLALVQGFAAALATILNNVIIGKILSAVANWGVDISGLTGNTVVGTSDVEEIASFEFYTTEMNPVRMNIPGLLEAVVLPLTNELDPEDIRVQAVISMFEDGIAVTGGTVTPCDAGEDLIAMLSYAREGSKNSGSSR